jgi:hypothetical protein
MTWVIRPETPYWKNWEGQSSTNQERVVKSYQKKKDWYEGEKIRLKERLSSGKPLHCCLHAANKSYLK